MKPLHIGLLITGAVLAGGLALTLSKPPAFPVAATPPASRVRVSPPAPTPAPAYAHAPAPVAQHAPAKPKPFPPAVTSPAPEFVSPEPVAPQPVYVEPVAPAVRKNKPISVQAKLTPPPPYLPPSRSVPVSAPPQSAAPASDPPSTSVPAAVAPSDTASITKGDEQKLPEPAPPPVPDPAPARHVTLRVGMTFKVRLDQGLSSERDFAGDTFRASLAEPLVVDGLVIAERGARVTGRIVESRRAGRLNGTSAIRLALTTLYTSDGQKVTISTDPWSKQGDSSAGSRRREDRRRGRAGRHYRRPGRRRYGCGDRSGARRGRRYGYGGRYARKAGKRTRRNDHPVPPGIGNDDHRTALTDINCRDSGAPCNWLALRCRRRPARWRPEQ